MIKAVAVDIDGTFLDDHYHYDKELFQKIFAKMQKQGAHFTFASGDQYAFLQSLAPQSAGAISYVSDNGAMVVDEGGQMVSCGHFDPRLLPKVIDYLKSAGPDINYAISGPKCLYVPDTMSQDVLKMMIAPYPKRQVFHDLSDIQGPTFKIITHVPEKIKHDFYHHLVQHFGDNFHVTISGFGWVDLIIPGCDKGNGLKKLLQRWRLSPDELAVFGDGENDLTMFKLAGHAYAMANANDTVKAAATDIAPTNNEQGVLKVLAQIFGVN